jgi:predicted nucleotidyltransferase
MGAERIVLFGSYAAGRRDLFTDLDLLAVIPSEEPFVHRLASVYEQVAPKVATDLLLYTPEEFEQMKDRTFLRHALKTSQLLYAS